MEMILRIINEPGDATRYDYVVVYQGNGNYSFASVSNSFNYPRELNYYDVRDLDEEGLIAMAKEKQCNPWTLKECISTIIGIENNSLSKLKIIKLA